MAPPRGATAMLLSGGFVNLLAVPPTLLAAVLFSLSGGPCAAPAPWAIVVFPAFVAAAGCLGACGIAACHAAAVPAARASTRRFAIAAAAIAALMGAAGLVWLAAGAHGSGRGAARDIVVMWGLELGCLVLGLANVGIARAAEGGTP